MVLNYFKLTKLPFKSNASRKSSIFKTIFCFQEKIKQFSLYKTSISGRNTAGRIILWTRTRRLNHHKTIKINHSFRYTRMAMIATFQFVPFYNKSLSLIFYANGSFHYILTSETHVLFNYIYSNSLKKLKKFIFTPIWSIVFFLKKLIFICNIEFTPGRGSQYCRSSGSKAKLMFVDQASKLALIQLPSKIKKFISSSSIVFFGKVALSEKNTFYHTKSGYWRTFGLKPVVRGVAMNPVDHPHGGRTKAVRYQRTPWGKTTKYK